MLYQPKRVFIQTGGNDIKSTTTATDVFNDIKNFVNKLIKEFGVNEVIIGSIFKRFKTYGIDPDEYETKRTQLNELLATEYKESDKVVFLEAKRTSQCRENIAY